MSVPRVTEGFLGTQSDLARSLGAEALAFTYRAEGATPFQASAAADSVNAINRVTAATYDVRDTVRALQAGVEIAFGAVTRHLGQIHGAIAEVAELLRNPQATASAEACREGYRALGGGDAAIARIYFDRAVDHRPNDVLGCFGRGLVACDEGDHVTAVSMFATSARAGLYGRRPGTSDRDANDEQLAQVAAMAVLLAVSAGDESGTDLSGEIRELLARVAEPLADCPEVQYEVARFADDPVPALAKAIYREPAYAIDAIGRFDQAVAAEATTTVLTTIAVDGAMKGGDQAAQHAGYRAALAAVRDALAQLSTDLPVALSEPHRREVPVTAFAEYAHCLEDARELPNTVVAIRKALDAAAAEIDGEQERVKGLTDLAVIHDFPRWAKTMGDLSLLVPFVAVAVIVATAVGGGILGWIVGAVAGFFAAGLCTGLTAPVINLLATGHFESDEASLARRLAEHKALENSLLNKRRSALGATRKRLDAQGAAIARGLTEPHRLEPRMPGAS
jgi:hypothetical protein